MKMRKWTAVFLALATLLCTGCSTGGQEPETTEAAKAGITYVETTTPEETPAAEEIETTEMVPEETESLETEGEKLSFVFPTDSMITENGRWLADLGNAVYDNADMGGAQIESAGEIFDGSVIAMKTKAGTDYNLMYWMGDDGKSQNTGLNAENSKLSIWVYVSNIDLIYDSTWTEIDLGSASWIGSDWAYWNLQQVFWQEGWNQIELDFSTAIIEGNFDMSALRWIRFCVVGVPDGEEFRIGRIELVEK